MSHQNLLPTILRLTTMVTAATEARKSVVDYLMAETVQRMKDEILFDIAEGNVPEVCDSFSDLNDHVDANEYGGFCENALCDAFIALFGGRDKDEGMPDDFIKFTNDCQETIDTWMRNGRPV